jgi:hypothetical protein
MQYYLQLAWGRKLNLKNAKAAKDATGRDIEEVEAAIVNNHDIASRTSRLRVSAHPSPMQRLWGKGKGKGKGNLRSDPI